MYLNKEVKLDAGYRLDILVENRKNTILKREGNTKT